MDNIKCMVKQRVFIHGRYPTLKRIVVGRYITVWSLIPCNLSFWMLPIGSFMQMSCSPKLWFNSKIRDFQDWRKLR